MSELVYVYAIVGEAEAPRSALERLVGIAGQPVTAVGAAGLNAITSPVPLEEFDAAVLNARVRDLAWLAPHAAAHQAVNEQLFALSEAILPLAFGTVFRDREGVERLLHSQGRDYQARLAWLHGQGEWVVTLQRDATAALAAIDRQSPELVSLRSQLAGAAPGRAYLLRRQLEQARRAALAQMDDQAVRQVLGTLGAQASAAFREEVSPAAAGATLARASFLVPRASEDQWGAETDRLAGAWAEHGYTVRVTGPWPPYRFSALEPETASARAE